MSTEQALQLLALILFLCALSAGVYCASIAAAIHEHERQDDDEPR